MLSSEHFSPPLLLGVVLVMMLVALLFSRSRAGIAGMGLGFLVFTLLVRLGSGRLPIGFLFGAIAIFGLTLLYGARIGFESIIDRFLMLEGGDGRSKVWADAWVIVQDHPLGVGLANFSLVFPIYKVQTTHEAFYLYAHNDYLQLLIEAGWPGFLSLVSGFFIFIGMGFRRICKMSPRYDPLRFFLGAGALSGLVSIGFHSFFDFNLEMPANAIYFVLLMAIVCACTQSGKRGGHSEEDGGRMSVDEEKEVGGRRSVVGGQRSGVGGRWSVAGGRRERNRRSPR